VALDDLGSFVIELCDGRHAVREIAEALAGRFRLSRREAETSLNAFLRSLTGRAILGMVVDRQGEAGT
jgi:hypothetical protein